MNGSAGTLPSGNVSFESSMRRRRRSLAKGSTLRSLGGFEINLEAGVNCASVGGSGGCP